MDGVVPQRAGIGMDQPLGKQQPHRLALVQEHPHVSLGLGKDKGPFECSQCLLCVPLRVVGKGSKNKDAAWEFIKCYTGPQLQAMVASLKASMPANKQVLIRMNPGGRPCLERISSQPSLESTTFSRTPLAILATSAESSLGSLKT